MSKTLIVRYTPRNGSNSKQILDAFLDAAGDKTEVILRDISDGDIPLISADAMSTWWESGAENSFETASSELIEELLSVDKVVIVTPIYNFGLPATVKAWFDLVIRSGKTFEMGKQGAKGLVPANDAALFFASGFTQPGEVADDLTSSVKTNLGFLGVGNVEVVAAGGLMMISPDEAEAAVSKAKESAAQLANNWYN